MRDTLLETAYLILAYVVLNKRSIRLQMAVHSYFLLAVLLWKCCTIISGLFTVEVRKSQYIAEYGSNVSMECQFTIDLVPHVENLNVLWKHNRDNMNSVEVVKYLNGKDIEVSQDKNHSARMKLLSNELRNGRAILHISNVKMTDAGQYYCMISSLGSDYKEINLQVQAPYRKITTQVREVVTSSGETIREVSCQSFGYPEANVTWMVNKENFTGVHSISYTLTADKVFNVTSVIRIPATSSRTLTCTFWNEITYNATSLTFTVSENVKNQSPLERRVLFASLATVIVIVVLLAVVYVSGQYKRCTGTKLHNIIHTSEAVCINAHVSSSEYSSEHFGSQSENTIVDVENTVPRLLNSS